MKKSAAARLPKGSIAFESEYGSYALVTKAASFSKALKVAKKYKGYLAEPDSIGENSAIYDAITGLLSSSKLGKTVASDGGGSAYVWLGGSDQREEGSWAWLKSGEVIAADAPQWGQGEMGREPDNFGGGQNFLALGLENWPYGSANGAGFGNAGDWNDINGSNKLFYVIEF